MNQSLRRKENQFNNTDVDFKVINNLILLFTGLDDPNGYNSSILKILGDETKEPFIRVKETIESLNESQMKRVLSLRHDDTNDRDFSLINLCYDEVCVLHYCNMKEIAKKHTYNMFASVIAPLLLHFYTHQDVDFTISHTMLEFPKNINDTVIPVKEYKGLFALLDFAKEQWRVALLSSKCFLDTSSDLDEIINVKKHWRD